MGDNKEEEALCKFLSDSGLTQMKWVGIFQRNGFKSPEQIQALEGGNNDEIYLSLSLDASPEDQAALRKIFHLASPHSSPKSDLYPNLTEVGLDTSYWSKVFEEKLGVQSPEALQYLGDESYQTLVQFKRKPWEAKALRNLLKMEDNTTFKRQHEKRKEKLVKRQAESAELLKVMKQLHREGKGKHDEAVMELEKGVRERLQVPESEWISKDTTLSDTIEKMKNMHKTIDNTLVSGGEVDDATMIRKASGGLALRGILISANPSDVVEQRRHLLRVPEDIQLNGPSQSQHDEFKQFESKSKEDEFSRQVDVFGYSVSAAVKAGAWGFSAEVGASYSKSEEKEETKEHHEERAYSSTIKYSFLPLASCSFRDHQLLLSEGALSALQKIDKSLSELQSVQEKGDKFISKFGSHAFTGPFHFGGRFVWKCHTSGYKESEKQMVQALQHEAISAHVSMSYGNIAGVSASSDVSSIKGNLKGDYSERLTCQTFVEVTITGGPPEVSGLPDWKNGLVGNNSTWHLIDRGVFHVPIWDIIEMNHESDFKNSKQLVETLKQAWKRFNQPGLEISQTILNDEVKGVIDCVTIWNQYSDQTEFESRLVNLVDHKRHVALKHLDPRTWATDYLSQAPLQHFLRSVVEACIQGTSEHSAHLKRYIRQLVEPIDFDIARVFPNQESIRKWLYDSEDLTPPIQCQDFFSLHEYFKHALEMVHSETPLLRHSQIQCNAIQPQIAIRVTATVAKAVFCFRSHLSKTQQCYEDCFVVTMLYPFGYDPENNRFGVLMTKHDIEYLCQEFTPMTEELFSFMKQKSLPNVQSYLFSLTIKLYDSLDVSEERVKRHVHYLQKELDVTAELSSCITELESNNYDWELFKHELESLMQGVVEKTNTEGVLTLQQILAREASPSVTMKEHKVLHQLPGDKNLFLKLGLLEYFPQKLALCDAISIREDTLEVVSSTKIPSDSEKCANLEVANSQSSEPGLSITIKDTRSSSSADTTGAELYPFLILQKIMAFDHRCRIPLMLRSPTQGGSISDSDSDEDDVVETIHPMDGLVALLNCSDNFLRQDLMSRLATCQLAVPLLLPDPTTHDPVFLMWALRSIIKDFKVTAKNTSYSGPIVNYPAPFVSFLRIGHHSISKSHLLNNVINTTEHPTFFHYDCSGGRAERILVNGLVEVSWYLPSKNDNLFPDAITFANLHGDARCYPKQTRFLSDFSTMHLVLMKEASMESEAGLKETTVDLLKKLSEGPGDIVVLETESPRNKKFHQKLKDMCAEKRVRIVKLHEKNGAEMKESIQKRINTKLQEVRCEKSLEDVSLKCNISLDEDSPDCVKGKELAQEFRSIVNQFKDDHPGESPKTLLDLQGTELWHKWAKLDKEQHRQKMRGHVSMFEYGALQRKKMGHIRQKQLQKAQTSNKLMNTFLTSVLTHEGPVLWYYLKWIKFILDDLSRLLLPPLHSRYNEKREELGDIQMQERKDEIAEKLCRSEMKTLNMALINTSFGIEHLFREVSQMYEAVVSQDGAPQDLQNRIIRLPQIAAQLLLDGFPIELMDGDAAHMPQEWISAVLERLSEFIRKVSVDSPNPQVLVLSVLGLQSTGKSTMLNTLFGVQFSVSAGRCTRGAFMQLLPVHSSLQKRCGVHYCLLIDTEGLRAPELDALQTQKHDNELATFVIGMANLTIINVKGEISGDMDDILQTAVHAFLRMKEVNLKPSCHFAHQNVGAVGADEKMMMGRFKIKEKLDDMTQEAAKETGRETEFRYFNQVIRFNYQEDVSFFPSLWTGSPPMAPVSPHYSVEAQTLKYAIIQLKTDDTLKSRGNCVTVLQLKQHLEELWKAILQENFVFSFKNTLEIAAYKSLEEQYGEWAWSFKKEMIQWEQTAEYKLMGCRPETLPLVFKELTDSLSQHVNRLHADHETKMNTFFDESPDQDIISKWKSNTETRLLHLKEKSKRNAENHCRQVFQGRKSHAHAEEKKDQLGENILERVQQLVVRLKKDTMTEDELKKMFEESWIGWMVELTPTLEKLAPPNVSNEVENSVVEIFGEEHKLLLNQRLRFSFTGKPKEWGMHLKLCIIPAHLKVKYWGYKLMALLVSDSVEEFLPQADFHTENVFKDVSDYLEQKRISRKSFNPEYTTEMLQKLLDNVAKIKCDSFQFTDVYKVDMALTACGYAIRVFEEMDDIFRKTHDPVECIEREVKPYCEKLFRDKYNQVAQEKTAADTLCQQLTMSIRESVINSLCSIIVDDIRGTYPWIRTKPTLTAKILLDIGHNLEEDSRRPPSARHGFGDCEAFLKNSKASMKNWIRHYAETYCDSGSPSHLSEKAIQELSGTIDFLKNQAMHVSNSFLRGFSRFSTDDWLAEFDKHVEGRLNLNLPTLNLLMGGKEFEDVKFFTKEVTKGLDNLCNILNKEFCELKYSSTGQSPHDTLFDQVAGCTEQCPFCMAQCELTDDKHTNTDIKHAVQHRPQCLGGYKRSSDKTMVLKVCTFNVASNTSFRNSKTGGEYHPYKKYQKYYPDWSIPPDTSLKASLFWKWLVGKYSKEIRSLFGQHETKIPEEWIEQKWEGVRKWMKEEYKV